MDSEPGLTQAMHSAKVVVLAILNRFGDSIIAAAACNEFIARWSSADRQFCIVTSKQLLPYIRVLCPNVRIITLHKNNPIDWLKLKFFEKFVYGGFDIGLNPYSFSKESRKIIKWATWSREYKHPDRSFAINYYDRVRAYFDLPLKGDFLSANSLPTHPPENILITPESSELRRCLTENQLVRLLDFLAKRWPKSRIVIASTKKPPTQKTRHFLLQRSKDASESFLREIRAADLVISVDSGPLHIAAAMNKPLIGIFSSTIPATVLNQTSHAYAWRAPSLTSIYCEVLRCTKPLCMDAHDLSDLPLPIPPIEDRKIEQDSCPYLKYD